MKEEEPHTDTGAGEDPDWGEGPEPTEPGHGAGETTPPGGTDPGMSEHPEDIRQPADQEGDETDTESPAGPPDPDDG
jgi:hypothetical protein